MMTLKEIIEDTILNLKINSFHKENTPLEPIDEFFCLVCAYITESYLSDEEQNQLTKELNIILKVLKIKEEKLINTKEN